MRVLPLACGCTGLGGAHALRVQVQALHQPWQRGLQLQQLQAGTQAGRQAYVFVCACSVCVCACVCMPPKARIRV